MTELTPAQAALAHVQTIKKEIWKPTQLDSQFKDTLDIALMHEKYGINRSEPVENFRLSKFDLNKLVEMHRNQL